MAITDLKTYLDTSPPVFAAVFWASLAMLGVICCLALAMLLARARYLYQERNRRHISSQWLPLFNAVQANHPCELPRVRPSSLPYLLELWVDYRKMIQGNGGDRLDELARSLNLDRAIRNVLRPSLYSFSAKPVWQQNVALTAVQWLHSKSLMRYVYLVARSENLHVAVSACFCLTKLKAPEYEQEVISLLFRFPNHSAYIATELSQAGSAEILQLMEPFIDDMPPNMATNFVALADKSNDREILPLLIRRLSQSREGREIAILVRTLGRLGKSEHRNLVAHFLNDERYYVRIQAIRALGKIGRSNDVRLLTPFLSDREWWARYRAARAIIRLLKRDPEAVENLRSRLEDRYAKDIITHAFTEMNWCVK